jgi:hypothetical protein
MLRQEADGARVRIVVFAAISQLDGHLVQISLIQQVPGKFSPGSR